MIAEAGRLGQVRQALVNPSDECLWNLLSACSNTGESAVDRRDVPSTMSIQVNTEGSVNPFEGLFS